MPWPAKCHGGGGACHQGDFLLVWVLVLVLIHSINRISIHILVNSCINRKRRERRSNEASSAPEAAGEGLRAGHPEDTHLDYW